ncbi:MAG: metal-dependent hydrolase [Chloroflexi bacterium]|nr:metal-dependent hydrolase [Chloroflexota bacterium]
MTDALGVQLTWFGHACVELVTADGTTVLIDPWFGNPRSPRAADAVESCDVLLVTHGHGDHLGDAIELAQRLEPTWPAIHELTLWAGPQLGDGVQLIGMNKGGTVDAGGLRVSMVRAEHSAGGPVEGAGAVYLGEPVGFVVDLGGVRVYHAGDTDLFGDMALIGELHHPDIAFLPIGGHYTMGPRAAARAVQLLGASTVVPIHYGTFPALAGTPDELRTELLRLGLGAVRVLTPEPGETVSL